MDNKFFMNRERAKAQSMKMHELSSMNSKTGYQDTGNDAQAHAKARAVRNNNNGGNL